MYFSEKKKRYSGNWWKTWGMRDSHEKGAGMQDQDPPFQTLNYPDKHDNYPIIM